MKVAVIGGGFTGLACATSLIEKNLSVTIFEKTNHLGGLAGGFKKQKWDWELEDFYHHIFTNDKEIISLAKKVDWPVEIYSPLTTSFIGGDEVQLDSPTSVLKFSKLSLFSRMHMGMGLAILKVINNGLFLEKYRVVDLLPKLIGNEGYQKIWLKLLKAKFGSQFNNVNMAWFWTRVAKRTKSLGYFKGGFQTLADKIGVYIEKNGGNINLKTPIDSVIRKNRGVMVNGILFDAVVITTPAPLAKQIINDIDIPKIKYLWGQTLILEINKKLIRGYWMNILEDKWPFLVTVEHTNMIDKKYYGGKEIIYLGNYLEDENDQLKMTKDELINKYMPYLKLINRNFEANWIEESFLVRKPFSQPVFPINYSQMLPKNFSKDGKVFVANMSMVYPFDRGTNYAVKMGEDVAKKVEEALRLKDV